MLRALRAAAEGYFEAKITTVEVVFPFLINQKGFSDTSSATEALSVRVPRFPINLSTLVILQLSGLDQDCGDIEEDRLVLTIDFSRAALTTNLFVDTCGIIERKHDFHSIELGADALLATPEVTGENIAQALHKISELPRDVWDTEADHISYIVLLGESACDHRFHDVLKEAFGKSHRVMINSGKGCETYLFAAARSAALDH